MIAGIATDLRLALAEVLNELGCEIEALGCTLCADPQFALRHLAQLQAIDLIAQKQHALAHVLAADCSRTAAAGLGLATLAHRFAPPPGLSPPHV